MFLLENTLPIQEFSSKPNNPMTALPIEPNSQLLPFNKLSWEDYEKFCYQLGAMSMDCLDASYIYGRGGQKQDGIDIYFNNNGKVIVWQVKRYQEFSSADIEKAVNTFLNGKWVHEAHKFVICAASYVDDTAIVDKIHEKKTMLFAKGIEFTVLTPAIQTQMSISHPEIIKRFFGDIWLNAFGLEVQPDDTLDITEYLAEKKNLAEALCKSKMRASQMSNAAISTIISNDKASNKYDYILEKARQGFSYLIGEYGSGKSHAILILFKRVIQMYFNGEYDILPVFFEAHELIECGGIRKWLQSVKYDGNFILFLDGLDEVEHTFAQSVVNDIELLRELKPNSFCVVGSRHMTMIPTDKCINIRPLSLDAQYELFSIIAEVSIEDAKKSFKGIEGNLATLISRPFFCTLYAHFKAKPRSWAKTEMDLVTALIDDSLNEYREHKSEVMCQLEQIAVASVNKNLGRVHKSELKPILTEPLLKTGFLFYSDEYYSFPLPIIAQWLAAQSIRDGLVSVKDIMNSPENATRWRYSLSILFSQMSFDESKEWFPLIAKKDASLASLIIRDGVRIGHAEEIPTAYECGKMLQYCMNTWMEALGPISQYIVPCHEGSLYNLAVDVSESWLITTWEHKPLGADIVVLSLEQQEKLSSTTTFNHVSRQSTWPWLISFDYLSKRLKDVVKEHVIVIEDNVMETEYVWNTTRLLNGKNHLNSIPLNSTERYRKHIGEKFRCNGHSVQLDLYFKLVDKLSKNKVTEVFPPYPCGDNSRKNNSVWANYSQSRMLEYVQYVYSHAIHEYRQLIDTIFPALNIRMPFYSFYPFELNGYLKYHDDNAVRSGSPWLTWYCRALSEGQESQCTIQLIEDNKKLKQIAWDELNQNNIKIRHSKRSWIKTHISSGQLQFSNTPVTDLIYKWLKDDLISIGWIEK